MLSNPWISAADTSVYSGSYTPVKRKGHMLGATLSRMLRISTSIRKQPKPYEAYNQLISAPTCRTAAPANLINSNLLNVASQYQPNLAGFITDGFCIDQTSCWQAQLAKGVPFEQTISTTHRFQVRGTAYNWRASSQAYPFDTYVPSSM